MREIRVMSRKFSFSGMELCSVISVDIHLWCKVDMFLGLVFHRGCFYCVLGYYMEVCIASEANEFINIKY